MASPFFRLLRVAGLPVCFAWGCEAPPSSATSDFRIVRGQTNVGDPAVAYLGVYDDPAGSIRSECSGTLIGDRWLLTAAHCLDEDVLGFAPGAIVVYFGATVLDEDPYQAFVTDASTYVLHERWDPEAPENGFDAALIKLSDAVPIPPVAIRRAPISDSDLGLPLRLVGWGITESGGYDSGLKRFASSQVFEYDNEIVMIGGPEANVCSGDSGGPALLQVSGESQILAITSFVDPLCIEFGFGTRVDTIATWIDHNVEAQSQPLGQFGDTCETAIDCTSNICVADDAAAFCSILCSLPADCPMGWACYTTADAGTNVCAPSDAGMTTAEPSSSETLGPSSTSSSPGLGDASDTGSSETPDDDDRKGHRRSVRCQVDAHATSPRQAGAGLSLLGLLLWLRRRRRPSC